MKTLHALASTVGGVGLALLCSTAAAGVFPQCPPDGVAAGGSAETTAGVMSPAKICRHMAAGA